MMRKEFLRRLKLELRFYLNNQECKTVLILLPVVIGMALWIMNKGWIFWEFLWIRSGLNSTAVGKITDKMMYVGQSASGNIDFFISVFISLSLICLIWSYWNASLSGIFQLPFYIGAWVSLGWVNNLLRNLSDPRLFSQLLLRAIIPLICGIIISVILFFILTWPKRSTAEDDSSI